MSIQYSDTLESIHVKINEQNKNYQRELNKGSGSILSTRKAIRTKLRELDAMRERLIKIRL